MKEFDFDEYDFEMEDGHDIKIVIHRDEDGKVEGFVLAEEPVGVTEIIGTLEVMKAKLLERSMLERLERRYRKSRRLM